MRAIIDEIDGQVEPDNPPQQNTTMDDDKTEEVPELERMRLNERILERRRMRLKAD